MSTLNDDFQIPLTEFEFSFARSGGPGGQNVNKVNTKAILRWPVTTTQSIPEAVKERFIAQFGTRITQEGDLVLTSQRYRDQSSNIEDCLEKLREMLTLVRFPPTPRRPSKPSKAVKLERVKTKREQGQKKLQRRRPVSSDD